MPVNEMINKKFGKLTVLERVTPPGQTIKYLCQCDCGNQKIIRGDSLRNGRTTSCGCYRKEIAASNYKDLQGQKFGKLTVLEKTEKRHNRNIIWKCQCDCGKVIEVQSGHLISGITTSCGCKRIETIHEVLGGKLLNKKFGKLTVIQELDSDQFNNVKWLCLCDCGNTHISTTNLLNSGKVQSCGCLNSTGELKIKNILNNSGIKYESQKKFDSCIFPNTACQAIFDFYVDDKYIIEFDGKQHFEPGGWGKDDKDFQEIQFRDNFKNEWCKKNNIPIIRIPYTIYNKLELKDLILETSKYII